MVAREQLRDVAPEAEGLAKGVAVAIVEENQDDSAMGRVRVRYPWYHEPNLSFAARVAVPMAGAERGTYFLPEVGDEVLVAFDRGDVRFPYVLGCLWNGRDAAPETNSDGNNDIRVIRSRKGHHLRFEDGSSGMVELQLNDGKRVTIDDDGLTIDDGSGNTIALSSGSGEISLQASTKLTISAPTIEIEATATLSLKAGSALNASGTPIKLN